MPSSNKQQSQQRLHCGSSNNNNGDDNKKKLGGSSEPILRSPTSASDKPTTEIRLPASPTSAADFFLILDEDLGSSLGGIRRRLSNLPNFPEESDPTYFDDELSQWSEDGDEEDDELLGLSFLDEE